MFDLTFTVDAQDTTTPLTLPIDQMVIAGWTGRDAVARDKHIAELEAMGIARPASTPIYYRASARRLIMEDSIECCGGESSGEVEFVLIGWQGRIFVGCGSDHTDRKVEAYNVTVSKQMCDKPIASTLWELEDVIGHWDKMVLRSTPPSTASACSTRRARWTRCYPSTISSRAGSRPGSCPTAAPCSAARLQPRAVSARRTGSTSSWRIRC